MIASNSFRVSVGLSVFAIASLVARAGIITPTPLLPPDGVYRTPADVHAAYGTPSFSVLIEDISHRPLVGLGVGRSSDPFGEIEEFGSSATGKAKVDFGPDSFFDVFFEVDLSGPVVTRVGSPGTPYTPGSIGTFDTEMLSMNLSGGSPLGPIMIRESPTLPSLGQTTITPLSPSGPFQVDSFFDIFTELSLDGGQSWIPSQGPTHVVLEAVPDVVSTSWLLLSLAGLGLVKRVGRAE